MSAAPTSPGLWYWKPENDREDWEVIYVLEDLKTFYGLGRDEPFEVGRLGYEEFGGEVPTPEELDALRKDKELLDYILNNPGWLDDEIGYSIHSSHQELRRCLEEQIKVAHGNVDSDSKT